MDEYYYIEKAKKDNFIKYVNNNGDIFQQNDSSIFETFCHYSFELSDKNIQIADIQTIDGNLNDLSFNC